MGDGYNPELDVTVGEKSILERTANDREFFLCTIQQYDGGEKKVDLSRVFRANTGRELRQPKLSRLSADEARRIGETLTTFADVILGPVKKGRKTRTKGKSQTQGKESPLSEDAEAAEVAALVGGA